MNIYKNDNHLKEELTEDDKEFINETLSETNGYSVKGKDVCLSQPFPKNKDEVALYLAILLKDQENLAYYDKLARERRTDFLKNCLKKTLYANNLGIIKKTLAAYFTGVVKNQTAQQKRLEEYKKRHKTLYGYLGEEESKD